MYRESGSATECEKPQPAVAQRRHAVHPANTLSVTLINAPKVSEGKLLSARQGDLQAMSTQRYLIGELLRKGRANQASAARWDFSIDFGIDAECRSVFYALTMPEYLETWLRPPDCSAVSVLQKPSAYSIQFLCNNRQPIRAEASWNLCRIDQMVLSWSVDGNTSTVFIRLQPCADRTILHLRHRRFASAEESLWHGELWTSSLERLALLIEHPGVDGSARARVRAISTLHRSSAAAQDQSRIHETVKLENRVVAASYAPFVRGLPAN